jgi:Zn-dependent protease with chaperone function
MRLVLVIIEGQLYLVGVVAIFVAEVAFLLWGLWSRRPIIGLVAVFVTLPLIRTTVSAIRACLFRTHAPEGLSLARSEAVLLHELVEEIGRTIDAPPVDVITLTGGFSASAAIDTPGWRFRRRRTLVLGFPVLATLSLPELRAVIAHELAHFSTAYDRFAAWVYRTRAGWLALRTALDRRLATPVYVYWLLSWYVPRLGAAAAPVSRRHELMADRVAAEVAGSRAAADALVAFEAGARFADDTHWPAVEISHETAAEPPRPYSQMLTWSARRASTDLLEWLVADDTDPGDAHPSFRERLAQLDESLRIPPPIASSAGCELLGPELDALARRFDEEWLVRYGDEWRQHRAEYVARTAALDRLAAIAVPTPDQLFERAEAAETLHGSDEALPIYQIAAEQGHAAASLAAGRVLLGRLNAAGIALVEAAMDRDERLVPEACRILAAYYMETDQELAARRCEWRARRHITRAHLVKQPVSPSQPLLAKPDR